MYLYKDFSVEKNGMFSKWKRLHINDIKKIIKTQRIHGCYSSLQTYENIVPADKEKYVMPFAFDFDDTDIQASKEDACKIYDYFREYFAIPEPLIKVKFSGNKGFHIIVHPKCIGVEGSPYNAKIFGLWANDIKTMLGLKTLDMSLYSKKRLFRETNTCNTKSGLYAIQLYISELKNKSIDDIRSMAVKPRTEVLWDIDEYKDIAVIDDLKNSYEYYTNKINEFNQLEKIRRDNILIPQTKGVFPLCIKDLLQNGLRKDNTRNKATLVLASYFKDSGYTIKETLDRLYGWILKQTSFVNSSYNETKRKALTRSVVMSVYNNKDKYFFDCAYIKSCGSSNSPIQCDIKCPYIDKKNNDDIIEVTLNDANNPIYNKKKLKIDVSVIGQAQAPYRVPAKIICQCYNADIKTCSNCKLFQIRLKNGKNISDDLSIKVSSNSENFVKLVNVSEKIMHATIRNITGVSSKCNKVSFKVEQYINVDKVVIVPLVEARDIISNMDMEFIIRSAYAIDRTLKINKDYTIETYPVPNPKTQELNFIIKNAKPKKSNYETFKMNKEIYDKLKIFCPKKDTIKSIQNKLDNIYSDFIFNITNIYERQNLMLALDLVFHSVALLKFKNTTFKGALELMVFGDTGCGKTTVAQKMMEHYNLGMFINGETATRTGLVYNYQQFGSNNYVLVWGAIPQNHGKLIVIDEFTGLDKSEIEKMSRLRSEGIAEATGIVKGKTFALTRMIFLSNTATGKFLKQYSSGVQALMQLFSKTEDVRRLDFAITVAMSDVSPNKINKNYNENIPHIYTDNLCHNLVLWAWSRKPEHIIIDDDTMNHIYKKSMELCSKYDCNCPLLSINDSYKRLMKLSTALACRLFSTEDGVNVIVKKVHIDYICEFLNKIYTKDSFAYDVYANSYRAKLYISRDDKDKIIQTLKDLVGDNYETFVMSLINYDVIRKNWLEASLGKDSTKHFLELASHYYLLENTGRGLSKTEKFVDILREVQKTMKKYVPNWVGKTNYNVLSDEIFNDLEDIPLSLEEDKK